MVQRYACLTVALLLSAACGGSTGGSASRGTGHDASSEAAEATRDASTPETSVIVDAAQEALTSACEDGRAPAGMCVMPGEPCQSSCDCCLIEPLGVLCSGVGVCQQVGR